MAQAERLYALFLLPYFFLFSRPFPNPFSSLLSSSLLLSINKLPHAASLNFTFILKIKDLNKKKKNTQLKNDVFNCLSFSFVLITYTALFRWQLLREKKVFGL